MSWVPISISISFFTFFQWSWRTVLLCHDYIYDWVREQILVFCSGKLCSTRGNPLWSRMSNHFSCEFGGNLAKVGSNSFLRNQTIDSCLLCLRCDLGRLLSYSIILSLWNYTYFSKQKKRYLQNSAFVFAQTNLAFLIGLLFIIIWFLIIDTNFFQIIESF